MLCSLWYHDTGTGEWSRIARMIEIIGVQFCKYEHMVLTELYFNSFNYFGNFGPFSCFSVMIPETLLCGFALLTMSACAGDMWRL